VARIGRDVIGRSFVWKRISQRPLVKRLTSDRVVTVDNFTRCAIITTRNRVTGEAETQLIGECDDAIIRLHAKTVEAKWKRPTEAEMLSRLLSRK
jgi:hypothetical protein